MKEILSAMFEFAKFLFGVVKPLCQEALQHPYFKILAIPTAVIGIGLTIKKITRHL